MGSREGPWIADLDGGKRYLTARRLDRWLRTRLAGRRYEFVLPGRVAR